MRARNNVSMSLKDWLIDLAKYNRIDMVDGEIAILPIMENENE